MTNFVVLVDYVTTYAQSQMHSFLREDNKAMQGVVGNCEGEGRGQQAKVEELVEKNKEKSRIRNQKSRKRKIIRKKINKLQNMSENEESELKLAMLKQEKDRFDTVKNESEMEKLKLELIRSKAEKDELERILSEKEEVIISQSQTLKRKNQNLKDLLNEINKSCANS